jgi:Pyruvate/2-oxoacid:ferredoxin oxidoreductase delta subunit
MIKKSQEIGKTGEFIAEFDKEKNNCIGCAQCAIVCPDIAIVEVYR